MVPNREDSDPAILVLHLALREWEVMPGHPLLQGIDRMANEYTRQATAQSGNGSPWPAAA